MSPTTRERGRRILLLSFISASLTSSVSTSSSLPVQSFKKTDVSLSSWKVQKQLKTRSELECTARCLEDCDGVHFNAEEGLCDMGSYADSTKGSGMKEEEETQSIMLKAATPATTTMATAPEQSWTVYNCFNSNNQPIGEAELVLDANKGEWPEDLFCLGYNILTFNNEVNTSYKMSVHFKTGNDATKTHIGLAYNYVNETNFDFIYVRGHTRTGECGSVVEGTRHMTGKICNVPEFDLVRWTKLEVANNPLTTSTVYLNSENITDCKPHFEGVGSRAAGGPLVANGYDNLLFFKGFDLVY